MGERMVAGFASPTAQVVVADMAFKQFLASAQLEEQTVRTIPTLLGA